MTDCELCNQGDPSVNVRCYSCGEIFHVHKRQLDMAPEAGVLLGDCPSCNTVNCWKKWGNQVAYSGTVVYLGEQVLDLRGK